MSQALLPPPRARLRLLVLIVACAAALVGLIAWQSGKELRATRVERAAEMEAAYLPDEELFRPLPPPKEGDWLAGPGRTESAQTFTQYVQSRPRGAGGGRTTIVLQPLGTFSPREATLLEKMRAYAAIFFGLPARLAPPRPLPQTGRRRRTNGSRSFDQYLTSAIMDEALRPNLPPDAVCYLGITMQDLYPEPDWNFVFGQASLRERVGVYSLARYHPQFDGLAPEPDSDQRALMRAVKVMVHETGHMFGLHHCRARQCVMNGSNHLAESDSRPVFLCPECLHKLHWNLKFGIIDRYGRMARFWHDEGFEPESRWLGRRLEKLRAAGARQSFRTEDN